LRRFAPEMTQQCVRMLHISLLTVIFKLFLRAAPQFDPVALDFGVGDEVDTLNVLIPDDRRAVQSDPEFDKVLYHRLPKFWTYGSVCCACAQRPGLPRACHSG
jgi:hypothetical protein